MSRAIKLNGYFGGEDGKPVPAELTAAVSGIGMGEILTLDCKGKYRVSVPYRPVERLAREALAQLSRGEKSAVEPSVRLEGQDEAFRKGLAVAYLRMNESFMMLTLDFMDRGQISAPFAPIEKMVREERSTFA